MANCPVYPASSLDQAINLTIDSSNRFHDILHGDIDTFVTTCSGGGQVPSVAKALSESAAYRVPLAWSATNTENDLLQPRIYNNNIYVPLTVPAIMDAAPSSVLWRLYGAGTAEAISYGSQTVSEALDERLVTVDTLAELQGFNGVDGQTVYVEGRSSAGDGYQGLFRITSADYSAKVTADTRSALFVELDNGLYAVRQIGQNAYATNTFHDLLDSWFGVAADDTTDDGPAIQAAIDLCRFLGGGAVVFESKAYRADELELKPGISLTGKTTTKDEAEAGLYTRITSQRATNGDCFTFNVGGVDREWLGRINDIYFRYTGAAETTLLRIEHAYAISTKNVRLLGNNSGDGLILSDVFDGSMEDTLITNFARTATITNSGSIDNSNNISFRRFHCETFFEYGLKIIGTALSQYSNNKLYFYHLKLEGRPSASGVANFITTGCNDIFIYGGHASITAIATPPTTYTFFDIGDNTRGLYVFGMQVRDNLNTNQISSIVKLSGTVNSVRLELSARQESIAALAKGLVDYASGAINNVTTNFLHLTKNASTLYEVRTVTPTRSKIIDESIIHGDIVIAGDSVVQERALTFTRSDISTTWQYGRVTAGGNLRWFKDATEVLRLDANNDVSAVNGNVRSLINGGAFIAKSPDGTFYKLTPPNGGGAASWVAV